MSLRPSLRLFIKTHIALFIFFGTQFTWSGQTNNQLSATYCAETLRQLLTRYETRNKSYLYSHELVKSWMWVLKPLNQGLPSENELASLLEPYGLAIQKGPAERSLIVANENPVHESLVLGRVTSRETGNAIKQSEIFIPSLKRRTKTNKRGCFLLNNLPPGAYTFEVLSQYKYREETRLLRLQQAEAQWLDIEISTENIPAVEELVVVGDAHRLRNLDNSSTRSLTNDELAVIPKNSSGLTEALKHLPGVVSRDTDARVKIRGGLDTELKVELDGLELISPYFMRNLNRGFQSALDISFVSSVDLYPSSYHVEKGNALGGYLVVDSLEPFELENRASIKLSTNAQDLRVAGSFDQERGRYVLFRRSNEETGNLGGANFFNNENAYRWDSSERVPLLEEYFYKLSYQLNDQHDWAIQFLENYDSLVLYFEDNDRIVENHEGRTVRQYFWTTLTSDWNTTWQSELLLAYSTDKNNRGGHGELASKTFFLDSAMKFEALTAKADWTFNFSPKQSLDFGARARQLNSQFNYQAQGAIQRLAWYEAPKIDAFDYDLRPKIKGDDYAAYVSWQSQPCLKCQVDIGVRWDKQTYLDINFKNSSQTSPRINAHYSINQEYRLHFSLGRYYQVQEMNELAISEGRSNYNLPEEMEQVSFGINRKVANRTQLRLDGYYKDYQKLNPRYEDTHRLNFYLTDEMSTTRFLLNSEAAEAYGIELSLNHKFSNRLSIWANHSIARAHDFVEGTQYKRNWDQTYTTNIGLNYRGHRWQYGVLATLHKGYPLTGIEQIEDASGMSYPQYSSEYNAIHTPAYSRADFHIAHIWHGKNNNYWRLYGNASNVFDFGWTSIVRREIGLEWSFW